MPNAILNVGQTGGQVNISTATAPATPAVGVVTLYAGTDKALHALNSDGTDITIAAAGAASPITVQQTNSLVSTAIGATASVSNAIVIGATASATTNSIVIGRCASASSSSATAQLGGIVIGNGACLYGSLTDQSIAIGQGACANGNDQGVGRVGLAIGLNAKVDSSLGGIAIGTGTCVTNTATAIGWVSCSGSPNSAALGLAARIETGADFSLAVAGYLNCITTNSKCSNAIGSVITISSCVSNVLGYSSTVCSGSNSSTIIGSNSTIFPGATGTIVLGSSSVGGTGACNSVVIGNSSRATGVNSVVIGNAECSSSPNSVLIGGDTNTLTSTGAYNTIINGTGNSITGTGACNFIAGSFSSSTCGGNNSLVGVDTSCINGGSSAGIISSINSCMTSSSRSQILGSLQVTLNGSVGGIIAGVYNSIVCSSGYGGIIGGLSNCVFNSERSLIIGGDENKIIATSATSAIIGGCSNIISGRTNSVIIGGNNITADANNTVYTPNLKVTGQAASLTNAVGSTGGTVTLNWDNSNIQTLTLTSSITTLTKSNPIDGAVYTLFLTQGGSGGYTVDFGADVNFAGGTGPTLSTAIGATDAVSLVYIAGITGYYGNANLNFA
jgi:hypothetical protein